MHCLNFVKTLPMNAPNSIAVDAEFTAAGIEISEELIQRFDRTGPRYTSYPTANHFRQGYAPQDYAAHLRQRAAQTDPEPLSVYVHLPFCESLCHFCACNKIITQDHSKTQPYLHTLYAELALVSPHLGTARQSVQLHLGGGTPTFLNAAELTALMQQLRQHFEFTADAEMGVEIDPRTVNDDTLRMLAGLGFNRTSFGVQDFDPAVQAAVNRVQPFSMVQRALQTSRDHGFRSINADVIYGLPRQTLDSFARTLDQLIALSPDRIALYNYAHLPHLFKAQRLINAAELPSAALRLQIFMMSMRRLLEAGYVFIGLDHFAKPDDELSRARLDHSLHRNFQGYTTRARCDMVGLGVSSIGKIGNAYVQNHHQISAWEAAIQAGQLPTDKGLDLTPMDAMRREVIMALMCCVPIDYTAFAARHAGQRFERLFADELTRLTPHAEAGLLEMDAQGLRILPRGRLFVRAMAMEFDTWLAAPGRATHSRLI